MGETFAELKEKLELQNRMIDMLEKLLEEKDKTIALQKTMLEQYKRLLQEVVDNGK